MHQDILSWLLTMPAKQRQLILASVNKMARVSHATPTTVLEFYYMNRSDLHTTQLRSVR